MRNRTAKSAIRRSTLFSPIIPSKRLGRDPSLMIAIGNASLSETFHSKIGGDRVGFVMGWKLIPRGTRRRWDFH